MKRLLFFIITFIFIEKLSAQLYKPTLESINSRPIPAWFSNAKFGIFIHWGPYSVPAYRPAEKISPDGKKLMEGSYAEWYLADVMYKPAKNDSFHIRNYGKEFSYKQFGPRFKAELFNPRQWAEIFANAGAKYVIFTAKHCDAFCMWPTKEITSKDWNVGDVGPKRDVMGELTNAVRAKGLKMGYYYSFLEFWSTETKVWPENPAERTGYYVPKKVWDKSHLSKAYQTAKVHNHIKYLVIRYKPDILWADAEWDGDADFWKSYDLISWIYNWAPNKDEIVLNDRWFDGCRGKHVGYITTEYGHGSENIKVNKPWEECQGMGYSFGYNRAENLEHYKSSEELVHTLVRTVSNGGNLLLNVGPAADGTIPVIMQERLKNIGDWLKVNGEAIYDTKIFKPLREAENVNPEAGKTIFFTRKENDLYVIVTKWSTSPIELKGINRGFSISMLGSGSVILTEEKSRSLIIHPPIIHPGNMPCHYAWVYKIAHALK